jgi:hypothetical protein
VFRSLLERINVESKEHAINEMSTTLASLCSRLRPPPQLLEADAQVQLLEWKASASGWLSELHALSKATTASADQADVISCVAAFDGFDAWISDKSRNIAQGMHFVT